MPNPFDSVPPSINATYAVYPNPITINNTGSGLQSLNALTASAQLFDSTDDANVTLTISSSVDTHSFELGWTGVLAVNRGGTGSATANGSLNNLLPDQTGQNGKVLTTDGTNTSWTPAGAAGTVTSVALTVPNILSVSGSPVTTTGTFAVTLATQAANIVFAGPTSGGAVTPTFRALVANDIPNLSASKITSGTVAITQGGTGAATASAAITALLPDQTGNNGKVLSSNGTVASWTTIGVGTVTSVGASGTNGISISGSPITSSGSITIGISANGIALDRLAQIASNTFLGNVQVGSANVVALSSSDVKSGLGLNLVENTALSTWAGSTNITTLGTIVTGVWNGTPISVAKGGCGIASYAIGDMLYASATTTLSKLAGNTTTTKKYLSQTGTGSASAAPSWDTIAATELTGTLGIAHGGTGQTDANSALNALLPDQTSSSGFVLTTDGTNTSWVAAGGAGTVTSVALTVPAILSVTGSPITGAGTFAVSLATQAANIVFAGPTTGSAATPTFRSLVAADIPNLDASKIATGALAVARGGTGLSSYTKGDLLVPSASTTITKLGVGTNGQILSADSGETTGLKWITAGTGTVTSVGAVGANGISVAHDIANPITTFGTFTIGILDNAIAFGKIVQIADQTILGNNSGSTGNIQALSAASARSVLSITNVEDVALSTWAGTANIGIVGTITSGTWTGSIIGTGYGGTGLSGYIKGDIIYSSATNTLFRLPGNTVAEQQFLGQTGTGSVSDAPAWDYPPVQIGGGVDISLISGGGTMYAAPFGGQPLAALKNEQQFIAGKTLRLRNLYVKLDAVPGLGNTVVFTVMVNGVASALTCTVGAAATTSNDLTHDADIVAGDLIGLKIVGTGTPASVDACWGFIG